MKTKSTAPKTIDAYVAGFPPDVQAVLERVRATIAQTAPDAEETIRYQMPTFLLKGQYLVYFAAHQKHIGLYPAPVGDAKFQAALSEYSAGKGTLKFPLDQPLPIALIRKIVKLRAREALAKAAARRKKR